MTLPRNPYIRALLVNVVLFGAAAVRLLQQMGTTWTARHTVAAYALGMVCLVSTGVVGTLSRRSPEGWSWLKVVMASIVCGLATMTLLLVAQRLMQNK